MIKNYHYLYFDPIYLLQTNNIKEFTGNILNQTEQEAPYKDDELVGLQVLLQVDPKCHYLSSCGC